MAQKRIAHGDTVPYADLRLNSRFRFLGSGYVCTKVLGTRYRDAWGYLNNIGNPQRPVRYTYHPDHKPGIEPLS